MLILDTDHLSEFDRGSAYGERLRQRLVESKKKLPQPSSQLKNNFEVGSRKSHRLNDDPFGQIPVYTRLQGRFIFYSQWTVLPWEQGCAELFAKFRNQGVRIGPMDLKIACIALNSGATLLTRNTIDFSKVPGLNFANWLD